MHYNFDVAAAKWFPKPKPHTNPWWIMALMFGILPLKVTKGNCTQLASCSQWWWSKLHCLLMEVLVCSHLGHILTWNSSPNTKWQVQGTWKMSSLRQALLRITCKKKWSYMELEISCIDSLIDRWLVTFMDRWLMTACGTNSEIQAEPVMFAPGKNFQHKLHDKILNLARWPEWQERKLKDRSLKSIKLQTG